MDDMEGGSMSPGAGGWAGGALDGGGDMGPGGFGADAAAVGGEPCDAFAVVVPGMPVATNFAQVEANRFMLGDLIAASTKNLTFFLTSIPAPLPDEHVASLYISVAGVDCPWKWLGFVSNEVPSAIVDVLWSEEEKPSPDAGAQLGVLIEHQDTIAGAIDSKVTSFEAFGEKIGLDLFNFMESFNCGVGTDIFDKWFQKLKFKLRHQPDWIKSYPR